jgi:hypothetical protein
MMIKPFALRMSSKRVRIADPVEARVELVNGMFDLPQEAKTAMGAVRLAAEQYARAIKAAADAAGKQNYDTGRLIAALDAVQASKDIACVAFILPHASKPE